MCSKRSYPSKRDAETARNARLRSSRNQPDFLRIYRCDDCCAWHLASNKHLDKDKYLPPLRGERKYRRWRD